MQQEQELREAAAYDDDRPDRTGLPDGETSRVQNFSFFRAGQVIDEQMQAIGMLNDLFARNLAHSLATFLRTSFEVDLVRAEQVSFNEFARALAEISYVGSVRLDPLRATSVLELDLTLAPPMVDLLLGGEGKTGEVRELTEIEESILSGVVEIICRELTLAWQPVGLSFGFEKRQMQTQVAHLLPLAEQILWLSFELRMPHARGILDLALPAVVSRTILRRLTGERNRSRKHAAHTRERVRQRADLLKFGATLQLPPVKLSVREMEGLKPGSVILLPTPATVQPELTVAGKPLFFAHAIRQGEYRGAHLLAPTDSEVTS